MLTHLISGRYFNCLQCSVFLETVLLDYKNGETFDISRPHGYTNSAVDEVIADFLTNDEDAVGYFGYAYYSANSTSLTAAAIQNSEGLFVTPTPITVGDKSYNPLARRIFMNLLNEEESLLKTAPFIQFGFSDEGSALVEETGYVAIPASDKNKMLDRISYGLPETVAENGSFVSSTINLITSTSFTVAILVGFLSVLAC